MYTIVQSTKFVGFQLRFVVLLQLSHKPVCSCPQHSISKLAVVYGIFLLKQSCVWSCVWIPQISSCVTQPVGFLGVPKKSLNSSVPFWVPKNKRKTYYPLPLLTRAAKSTYFPKALGYPASIYYGFVTQLVQVWVPASATCHGYICGATSLPIQCLTSPAPYKEMSALPASACEGLTIVSFMVFLEVPKHSFHF